jgi:protein Mpv17
MHNASLIFNPLKQLWGAYERQLERRPVLTQMTTSAVLWCSGDVIAQRLEHWERQVQQEKKRAAAAAAAAGSKKPVKGAHPSSAEVGGSDESLEQLVIDWRRAIMTGMFGSTFVGPVGHFWYINLDKWCARVFPGGGAKFIAAKVGLLGLRQSIGTQPGRS